MLVHIKAKKGLSFKDLIDTKDIPVNKNYLGSWANIIIKAKTIDEALTVVPRGLKEKGFEIKFIDKVENFNSLVKYKETTSDFIKEANWLLKIGFRD